MDCLAGKFADLEVGKIDAIYRNLYIVIQAGLHDYWIHILGEARQKSTVCSLEDSILGGDELPRGGEGDGYYRNCGVECACRRVWILLGDRIWLTTRGGAALGSNGQ